MTTVYELQARSGPNGVPDMSSVKAPPFRLCTMSKYIEYYWEHCGHHEVEVPRAAIDAWYAERGWYLVKRDL